MIKSNSKKALERIRQYIVDGFHDSDFESWNGVNVTDLKTISRIILADFERVTGCDYYYRKYTNQDRFVDFTRGLPSLVDCGFWCGCDSGKDLLAAWLEETETEKNKYSEDDACIMIARLIYRELTKAAGYTGKETIESILSELKKGA